VAKLVLQGPNGNLQQNGVIVRYLDYDELELLELEVFLRVVEHYTSY
jgi:hypothetical protein